MPFSLSLERKTAFFVEILRGGILFSFSCFVFRNYVKMIQLVIFLRLLSIEFLP